MLISSRLITLGQHALTTSNGTDTSSNSRITFFNEGGATVTQLHVIHPNWEGTASGETTCPNAITVTASIEYPAGTFNQVKWNSAASVSIASSNMVSDTLTLSTPIPYDAQAWVNTFVSVSAAQVWCLGYFQVTGLGEAVDVGAVDKTLTGGIVNNSSRQGYGPIAVVGDAWATNPRRFAMGVFGDSLSSGPSLITPAGPPFVDDRGNESPWGRAAGFDNQTGTGKKVPYMTLSIPSQAVRGAGRLGLLNNRIDAINKTHPTHVGIFYGTNDMGQDPAATVELNLSNLATYFYRYGYKMVTQTIPPQSTSTDGWITTANQTAVTPGWADGEYSTYNNWIRTTPFPFVAYADTEAAVVFGGIGNGIWQIGGGTSTTNYTGDGIHWDVTQINPEKGGMFPARDAVLPVLAGLCNC